MVMPEIGSIVQWFNQANPKMLPQAAMVIGHMGKLLILNTIDIHGVPRLRSQVRHIDDEFLKDNQSWRLNYGAWRELGYKTEATPVATAVESKVNMNSKQVHQAALKS